MNKTIEKMMIEFKIEELKEMVKEFKKINLPSEVLKSYKDDIKQLKEELKKF